MEKTVIVISVCLLSTLSFFSGCVNVPTEFTQFSIISFDVEPGIINQGEYANLSWVVINASSVNIDNGIGIVALTGHRIIQPTQTTTYILTASNATTTKSATTKITVKPAQQTQAVEITDGIEDVSSINSDGDGTLITYSPEIDVDNLDLIEATYTLQGTQVTLTLQVKGTIENRGKIFGPNNPDMNINAVGYEFRLTTSEEMYTVEYANETCQLSYSDVQQNLTTSEFSVVRDTLTIFFTLASAEETYQSLDVSSTYKKFNLSAFEDPSSESDIENAFIFLSDVAPNPPLVVYDAYASNIGSIGESIQFNGSLEPLTGEPPYTYYWDFGDQDSSTQQNPTHTYTKAGVYTYNFTVTDNGGATASQSGNITIKT